MEQINITINKKACTAPVGSTILAAAEQNGIHIPTLCHIKDIDPRANCRMCIVQIERFRTFQPACATRISEGMVIMTDTPEIRQARKTTLELILSNHAVDCHHCMRIGSTKCDDLDPKFCEMCFFCDCVKDGFCELQKLAREYHVDVLPFVQRGFDHPIDDSTGSIIRNPNKCIKCRRCMDVCNSVQSVHNLCDMHRGTDTMIVPALNKPMAESACVQCGRCATVCPTGAIFEKEHIDEFLFYTHKYETKTVAQVSENVLEELAVLFNMSEKKADIRLVAAGLHKVGVDYVVSERETLLAVHKLGQSALEKVSKQNLKTIIVTNSPAANKFLIKNYPQLAKEVVYYPSTQQYFGTYFRDSFAKEKGINSKNMKLLSITNDNENASEAVETGSVNYVMNAKEIYRMFLRTGVDLKKRRPEELDKIQENEAMEIDGFWSANIWTLKGEIKEFTVQINRETVPAASANTLGGSRELLQQIQEGNSSYKVVRINA